MPRSWKRMRTGCGISTDISDSKSVQNAFSQISLQFKGSKLAVVPKKKNEKKDSTTGIFRC